MINVSGISKFLLYGPHVDMKNGFEGLCFIKIISRKVAIKFRYIMQMIKTLRTINHFFELTQRSGRSSIRCCEL